MNIFYTGQPEEMNNRKITESSGKIDSVKTGSVSVDKTHSELKESQQQVAKSVDQVFHQLEEKESAAERLKNYQILHLDDEAIISRLVKRVLSRKNLNNTSFSTADELLATVESASSPTVIISDNNLEGSVTGIDIAESTYGLRREKQIAFVLFCSEPTHNKEKFLALMQSGAIDCFIEKPSSPDAIIAALEKAIK
jgi:CheY-like chemotaxis protein